VSADQKSARGAWRVWDAPTRLFHWLLVGAIAFAWWSAETDHMDWHLDAGYFVLGLVVFRLYWGFVGSTTARFGNFVVGPRTTLIYLCSLPKRAPSTAVGHNPLGAWSIVAMLLLITVLAVLGLFAVDTDGLSSGPLSDRVDYETARLCAQYHATLFHVLQGLIALHILAVLFYLFYKRDNLIGPMLHGTRRNGPAAIIAPLWRALPGLALAVAVVWFLAHGLKLG